MRRIFSSLTRALPLLFVAFWIGCHAHPSARNHNGTINGLARDHDSGDPIAEAEIRVKIPGQLTPMSGKTSEHGLFTITDVPPGQYSVIAAFAGQTVEVDKVPVSTGDVTTVDLVFRLGETEPLTTVFGDPSAGAIDHYHPKHGRADVGIIEGTMTDSTSRVRVPGAVITATSPVMSDAVQAVSDEQGRFKFENLAPGVYALSAYYSVTAHGQIEVQRNGLQVVAGQALVVPLWVELEGGG